MGNVTQSSEYFFFSQKNSFYINFSVPAPLSVSPPPPPPQKKKNKNKKQKGILHGQHAFVPFMRTQPHVSHVTQKKTSLKKK